MRTGMKLPRYRCLPLSPYQKFGQGCGAVFEWLDLKHNRPEPVDCPVCGNAYVKWINGGEFVK